MKKKKKVMEYGSKHTVVDMSSSIIIIRKKIYNIPFQTPFFSLLLFFLTFTANVVIVRGRIVFSNVWR